MAVSYYRRVLKDASRLTQSQQARLIKKLAQLVKSGGQLDLSKTEDAVAFVERMRAAESSHANGRLKSPKEFLAEIESWKG
jgi:hypothetical protein